MNPTTASLQLPTTAERLSYHLSRYWIVYFTLAWLIYTGLPFLAPVLMAFSLSTPAHIIYFVYSFLCHQLPERSFFLFGPKFMYPLSQIQAAWQYTNNPLILRQFIGNTQMGWKVGWSDRMVSMYTSIPLFGLVWWSLRNKLKPLPLWGLFLFLLPMGIDGGTHFLSDLSGIGLGFRYTNQWLAALTHEVLPNWFYYGDAIGSFNSYMRLLTGALFGIGIVWFGLPMIDEIFQENVQNFKNRYLLNRRSVEPEPGTEAY
jgi:uncharacterized membrane protein